MQQPDEGTIVVGLAGLRMMKIAMQRLQNRELFGAISNWKQSRMEGVLQDETYDILRGMSRDFSMKDSCMHAMPLLPPWV